MSVNAGTAYVDILPETKGFGSALDKEVEGASKSVNDRMGNMGQAMGKVLLGVGAGVAGLGAIAVKNFMESEQVAAQTEAVLKSTGGAAKVSADQIGGLADKLSKLSGVDDEAIQSGENLLLTFTNIKNGVGAGNDIFNQTTKTMLDMSVALGQDTKSSAIQLGKALNDPVKGVTALQRVGVSFTEAQKDQIKALVDSGKTMDAQKLILKELQTEFGGSAEAAGNTFAGQMNKLKVAFGNVTEEIGAKLVPVLSRFATAITGFLTSGGLDRILDIAGKLAPVFAALAAVAIPAIIVATYNWAAANVALAVAFVAANAPLIAIVAAIGLVVGAIVYAWTHFDGFRAAVEVAIAAISKVFGDLAAWAQAIWPQVSEAIGHFVNVGMGFIRTFVDVVSALWRAWGDDLLAIAKTIFGYVQESIGNALDLIKGIIQAFLAVINGDWGKAWDGLKMAVGAVWDQIKNIVSTAIDLLKSALGGLVSTIVEVGKGLWEPIKEGFKDAINWVLKAWNALEFKIPAIDLPGPLGKVGGFTIGVPDIPLLAAGGMATRSGFAVTGENGPELTWLPRGAGVAPLDFAGGSQVTVNLNGGNLSPFDVADEITWAMRVSGR